MREKLCKTKEELIEFVKFQRPTEWEVNSIFNEPEPRYPIMAIVRVGDGFEDDMDLNGDEDLEASLIENNGEYIPVCGTSYDGGSGLVITPFTTSASDAGGVTFIDWGRVYIWRYLTEEEGLYKWRSLLAELPSEKDVEEKEKSE